MSFPTTEITLKDPPPKTGETACAPGLTEHRLQLALEAGKLGAWELDLRTRVLTCSAQCKTNHGLPPDAEMPLEAMVASIEPEHRAVFSKAVEQAIAARGTLELEVLNRWPDGSLHFLLVSGRVANTDCMVGVTMDTTERRKVEQALRESEARALKLDSGMDEFLALLAHELRNPLTPILASVKLLQLKGPPDPVLISARDTIVRQTLQLAKLVEDLMDVGRLTVGKLRLEKQRVELNTILTEAVTTCRPALEQRHHTLEVSPPGAGHHLHVDAGRIVQVLCNLMNNAGKYMKEGGRIHLSAAVEDGTAIIRVRDEGVGIAPEMLNRIFERYVQVDTSLHRAAGGLGLGLMLVKSLVEAHGGTVEAHSAGIGQGSEFIVRLPVATESRN
jgi:signal transduction histidine kinase